MTVLQCLSHQEQMEAHRQAFNLWFWTTVEPVLREQNASNEERAIAQSEHWKAYLKKNAPEI